MPLAASAAAPPVPPPVIFAHQGAPAPTRPSAPALVLLLGLVFAGAVFAGHAVGPDGAERLVHGLGATAASFWGSWRGIILNPAYWAFLALLCVLQWRFPARRELPGLGVGLGQDLVWFLASTALSITVVAAYLTVLDRGYVAMVGDWSLNLQDELGAWGLPVVALAITDLMAFTSHYLHHKVPALWAFHAVHHSQEEMNVLSDSRQHLVETMITATLVFIPARILGLDSEAAAALTFLGIYVGAFIHANIRTNLGPARFLLNSPQAHRVHHSAAPEHIDTNFAVILGCWDYLFGTRYVDDDEYPTTGIHDRNFPLERSARPDSLLGTFWRQNTYPFRRLRTHGLSFDPDR